MTDCNLETCSNTITGRQIYCSDRCRQRGRKGSRVANIIPAAGPPLAVAKINHPGQSLRGSVSTGPSAGAHRTPRSASLSK